MSRAWLLTVFVLPLLFAALPLVSIAVGDNTPVSRRAVAVTSVAPDLPAVPGSQGNSLNLSAAIDPLQDCAHPSSAPIEG